MAGSALCRLTSDKGRYVNFRRQQKGRPSNLRSLRKNRAPIKTATGDVMCKRLGILVLLAMAVATLGCGEDDGPHFVEPPAGKVPTADYGVGDSELDGLLGDDVRTFAHTSKGGFTLPTTPISQACSILDGGVITSAFSSYWNACLEAPLWTIEATVESILRNLSVFWNSSFVPCDCSDIDPRCRMNAFASSEAPGFIWYDDALVNLMSEGESLGPVDIHRKDTVV